MVFNILLKVRINFLRALTPIRKYMYKNPSIRLSHSFNDFCNNKPYTANFEIETKVAKIYLEKRILMYE